MFENRGRGIGDKGKDNGLLVLLAVKDEDVQVEVGYDLEQFITDGLASEVSRNDMRPHFVRGDYGQGLLAGVTRIIGRIAQGRGVTLSDVPQPASDTVTGVSINPWLVFAIIIIVMILMNSGSRRPPVTDASRPSALLGRRIVERVGQWRWTVRWRWPHRRRRLRRRVWRVWRRTEWWRWGWGQLVNSELEDWEIGRLED